jgi:hypothetical protein
MTKHIETKSPAMLKIYNDFYGNIDRLKSEIELCKSQYKEVMSTLKDKNATFNDRMEMRKITDYWVRRRQALERCLPEDIHKKIIT